MGKGTTQLGKYIWVPKPKSDLKEFRESLKIANVLESREGYFNDQTLGKIQVKRGAIFDGSLEIDEYFEKYEKKAIADQSYVSNARMTLRLLRWFGWVTRSTTRGRFNLTPHGKEYLDFSGKWPDIYVNKNELIMMTKDIVTFKYYSGNDLPQYQDTTVKKRPMLAILIALNELGSLHNHEISVCALTDTSEMDIDKIKQPVLRIKKGESTIQDEYRKLGWDPEKKSHVTGVYDGPKVLCSLLKQLLLIENTSTDEKEKEYYKRAYKGRIINSVPRNLFKITNLGKETIPRLLKPKPIWWEDLEINPPDLSKWI